MLLSWMQENLWITLIVWILLSISDYALTLLGARWSLRQESPAMSTQGSYKLNPDFVDDIDRQRMVSVRFIFALGWTTFLVAMAWLLARLDPLLMIGFELILGAMVLLELTIHLRHLRNLLSFRRQTRAGELEGSIVFSRRYVFWAFALDLILFALFYFILFLFVGRIFFLGGVIACGALAVRHRLRGRHEPLLATTIRELVIGD